MGLARAGDQIQATEISHLPMGMSGPSSPHVGMYLGDAASKVGVVYAAACPLVGVPNLYWGVSMLGAFSSLVTRTPIGAAVHTAAMVITHAQNQPLLRNPQVHLAESSSAVCGSSFWRSAGDNYTQVSDTGPEGGMRLTHRSVRTQDVQVMQQLTHPSCSAAPGSPSHPPPLLPLQMA